MNVFMTCNNKGEVCLEMTKNNIASSKSWLACTSKWFNMAGAKRSAFQANLRFQNKTLDRRRLI